MKKNNVTFSLLIALLSVSSVVSFAHPGRTDSNGGHYNRKTGTYHYHNGGNSGRSSTTTVPSTPARPTSTWPTGNNAAPVTPSSGSNTGGAVQPPAPRVQQPRQAAIVQKDESYYRMLAAAKLGGRSDALLADGSKCDVVTNEYAIAVNFSEKGMEAIERSLRDALQAQKKAGVVLVANRQKDLKNVMQFMTMVDDDNLPIKLWLIDSVKEELVELN